MTITSQLDHRADWIALAEALGPGFADRAAAQDAEDRFVAENYAEMKQHGLFAAAVPTELGGGGASHEELCAMLRTLARYCGSTALALSMHTHQVAIAAWRWQHDKAPTDSLLRRVASEQIVLLTSGGADWLHSSGTAQAVDGGYRVRARKPFASGTPAGSLLMTSAVLEDAEHGATVLHFPVPLTSEGVRIAETWRAHGMRATGSHDILLEDVVVPEAAVGVRRPKGKWHPLYHIMAMLALPLIYSVYVGVAEAARDLAIRAVGRKRDDPGTQLLAGAMDTELALARMSLDRMVDIAAHSRPGVEVTNAILIARALLARGAIRTVETALEVAGGRGFYRELGLERLWRDVQGARYHPLPETEQRRYSGRLALGLDIDG